MFSDGVGGNLLCFLMEWVETSYKSFCGQVFTRFSVFKNNRSGIFYLSETIPFIKITDSKHSIPIKYGNCILWHILCYTYLKQGEIRGLFINIAPLVRQR